MTTPLGLSRQHLSYLQEIGSGWFGKVSGAWPRWEEKGMSVPSQGLWPSSVFIHVSSEPRHPPPPPTLCPQPHHRPHLCSPLTCPRSPSCPPTSVIQRFPPHSIDHSAWPPGAPCVRLSIFPSFPASVGLWARASRSPSSDGAPG